MMNVVYCEVDYAYVNSHIMCYFVDVQGNECEYKWSPTKSNQYVYIGEILLRDYDKDDLTLFNEFCVSHYMSEILEIFILSEEPLEFGNYKRNMEEVKYKFGDFYEDENVNIKGKLQGMITLQINNFSKKREYLDKTIPLEKLLSQLEGVSVYCKVQIENGIYELYNDT